MKDERNLFHGLEFVVDTLSGERGSLCVARRIEECGGYVRHQVSKTTSFLVAEQPGSFVHESAAVFDVPAVYPEFVEACCQSRAVLNPKKFCLRPKEDSSTFTARLILSHIELDNAVDLTVSRLYAPGESARDSSVFGYLDKHGPFYPESEYVVARRDCFKCVLAEGIDLFLALELHVAPATFAKQADCYRVLMHKGMVQWLESGEDLGVFECRYYSSIGSALRNYAVLCESETQNSGIPYVRSPFVSNKIGSVRARLNSCSSVILAPSTEAFLGVIFEAAQARLSDVVAVPVNTIGNAKVEKAEAVLYEMWELFRSQGDVELLFLKRTEFLKLIPVRNQMDFLFSDNASFEITQDLLTLIRSFCVVWEVIGASLTSIARYRALRIEVEPISLSSPEFERIVSLVRETTLRGTVIHVTNVFSLNKPAEREAFLRERALVGNERLLFHGSPSYNCVSILSTGLRLPRVVVSQFRGRRPLGGLLGYGVYFSSSASKSIVYCDRVKGKGYLLVCSVVLGKSYDTREAMPSIREAPAGFDSVHGVKADELKESIFADDEFAVYSEKRQSLQYLIEFDESEADTFDSQDALADVRRFIEQIGSDVTQPPIRRPHVTTLTTVVEGFSAKEDFGEVGLIGSGGSVELLSIHCRALLVDTVGRVAIFQEYLNDSGRVLEGKYVFPLDEYSAVCGFEAFIGPKHVVGVCQEKEKAHKAYREAIARGDGAYLMDEEKDKPNVFTVSVGNIPTGVRVVIKIIYVTELGLEGNSIRFHVPATLTRSKKEGAGQEVVQNTIATQMVEDSPPFSVQVGCSMPNRVRVLHSPTHEIKTKIEGARAAMELANDDARYSGEFLLLVQVDDMNQSRLWVEENADGHVSAMVTFFPTIPLRPVAVEIVFLCDISTSMEGDALKSLKRSLMTALSLLPSGSTFNIVTFGDDSQALFLEAAESNNREALKQAVGFVQSLCPDGGASDLFHALERLYALADRSHSAASGERSVLLLSDGEFASTDFSPTIDLITSNADHTRLFAFALGPNQDLHSLLQLTGAGGGAVEFIKDNKNEHEKIVRQMKRIHQSGATGIHAKWPSTVQQAPRQVPGLFPGERQIVYAFGLPKQEDCRLYSVVLRAIVNGQSVEETITCSPETFLARTSLLHILGARALVRDWELGVYDSDSMMDQVKKNRSKDQIIDLGVTYSLVTQFTSFVAIEKRVAGEQISDRDNLTFSLAQEDVDVTEGRLWSLIEQEKLDAKELLGAIVGMIAPLELTHYEWDDYGGDVMVKQDQVARFIRASDKLNHKTELPAIAPTWEMLPTQEFDGQKGRRKGRRSLLESSEDESMSEWDDGEMSSYPKSVLRTLAMSSGQERFRSLAPMAQRVQKRAAALLDEMECDEMTGESSSGTWDDESSEYVPEISEKRKGASPGRGGRAGRGDRASSFGGAPPRPAMKVRPPPPPPPKSMDRKKARGPPAPTALERKPMTKEKKKQRAAPPRSRRTATETTRDEMIEDICKVEEMVAEEMEEEPMEKEREVEPMGKMMDQDGFSAWKKKKKMKFHESPFQESTIGAAFAPKESYAHAGLGMHDFSKDDGDMDRLCCAMPEEESYALGSKKFKGGAGGGGGIYMCLLICILGPFYLVVKLFSWLKERLYWWC